MSIVLAAEWMNASAILSCGTLQDPDRFQEDDRGRGVPPAGLTLMTTGFLEYTSVGALFQYEHFRFKVLSHARSKSSSQYRPMAVHIV